MSSLNSHDSESKNPCFYSRKEKSLGVLCSNFLNLYNRDGVDSIGLDDAATRLGVERRRIYDIVNILESIGVLSRKAKNQYSWKGFAAIPQALDKLKEEGLKENLSTSTCSVSENVSSENEYGGPSNAKTDVQKVSCKVENRKEKSLGLLTQNFIKLFLCSKVDLISLDTVATALLGDIHDQTTMRTKVRRLYDIANVFSSMDLIEKTHHPESRKPAFRWLGMEGNSKNSTPTVSDSIESKKRVFGTEITNTCLKRHKGDSSTNWETKQKANIAGHTENNNLEDKGGRNSTEQHSKQSSKDFVYGPFAPAIVTKPEDSGNRKTSMKDWENLASYRPQYRNQGDGFC